MRVVQGVETRQQRRLREREAQKAERARRRAVPGALAMGVLLAAAPATAAVITVNSLGDDLNTSDGLCTLREAIDNANADALVSGDCAAGSNPDVIVFQPGLTGTLTLENGDLDITDSVTITGPGASVITVSGNNASRIFDIERAGVTPIDVTITGLTLTNGAANLGGAISSGEHLTLDQVVITGSVAAFGGGVYLSGFYGARLTVTNSTISGNTATVAGGGLYAYYAYDTIYLKNNTITGNQAGEAGGGVLAVLIGGSFTMLNTVVSNNTAGTTVGSPGAGGGLLIGGFGGESVTISDSVITGNVGDPQDNATDATTNIDVGYGGGLSLIDVDATVSRTTISGNTAYLGGGVYIGTGAYVTFENVTIAGNAAKNPARLGGGGGVYMGCECEESFFNETTIIGNSAQTGGGGIEVGSAIATLYNSIVANNTSGEGTAPDIEPAAGTVTATYTLIKTPGSATIGGGTGNITGVDPQLGPLAINGSTIVAGAPASPQAPLTAMPDCASPVLNAGDPAFAPPPATDERGAPRVAGGRIDMGAVERQPSTVQFTTAAQSVNENAGSVNVTVSRTGADGAINVNYATADGTAKGTLSGVGTPDYTPQGAALTWAAGDTASKSFAVPIVNDNVFEGNETFTATLGAACGATAGAPATQTITIVDGQTQPTLSIGDVSKNEGNAGPTPFPFPVTLSGPSVQTVTASFETADGTAVAPGDYTATSGVVTFNPGVTEQEIVVQVVGDTAFEVDKTFVVNLGSPSNAGVTKGTGTGTILNDDAAVADIGIVKTPSGTFTAGSPASYSIVVTNHGPDAAGSVVAMDTVPAGTTLVSATPSQGTCSGTTSVTCDLGTLLSGATATITFTVTPTAPGPLSNTATASAAQPDPNPANNSSTASTTVGAGPADIGIRKTASGTFAVGSPATYTIVVTNDGPNAAQSVSVTDTLPAGTTLVSATPTQGSCSGTTTITCDLGAIASGGSATITLTVTPTAAGPLVNTAMASAGAQPDPNPANNSSSAVATVGGGPADIGISKTASGAFVVGSPATYTITVTNSGPNPAASVLVTDVLPAGATLVSATPSQGVCGGTTTVTCNLGPMASGGSATIVLTVTPNAPGSLSNTASASAPGQADPTPANNSSTVEVVVDAPAIPTLHEWVQMLLAAVMAGLGLVALRRRSGQ